MSDGLWHGLTRSQIDEIIMQRVFDARTRQILRLKDLDGMTFDEISEAVMLSESAVKKRYYKSHDELKGIR